MSGPEQTELTVTDLHFAHPEALDANLMSGLVAATIPFAGRTAHSEAAAFNPVEFKSDGVGGSSLGRSSGLFGGGQFSPDCRQRRMGRIERRRPLQIGGGELPVFRGDRVAGLFQITGDFRLTILCGFLGAAVFFFLLALL